MMAGQFVPAALAPVGADAAGGAARPEGATGAEATDVFAGAGSAKGVGAEPETDAGDAACVAGAAAFGWDVDTGVADDVAAPGVAVNAEAGMGAATCAIGAVTGASGIDAGVTVNAATPGVTAGTEAGACAAGAAAGV
ncbi:protein of unknown function [Burkholderia multivorans]